MTEARRIPEEATPELPTASARTSKRPGFRESRQRPMFDTLQVADDLKKGGFTASQADALVSVLNAIFRNMVTRAELKAELKAALSNYPTKAELKAELKATLENYPTKIDLAALETRLTMRMYMMTSLMASLTVGVITLVIKL